MYRMDEDLWGMRAQSAPLLSGLAKPRFHIRLENKINDLPNSQFTIVGRRDQIFHVAAREYPLSELA